MRYSVALVYAILVLIISCSKADRDAPHWKPEDGYVPDGETAKKIAEVLWVRIYGDKISEHGPFKVSLKDSSVWIIEGNLKSGLIGGTPYAEIRKSDGKVLRIDHTK